MTKWGLILGYKDGSTMKINQCGNIAFTERRLKIS